MTAGANPALAEGALANIRGVQDAQRLLFVLRDGVAPADALLEAVQAVLATKDPDRLRGLLRECQKALERGRA